MKKNLILLLTKFSLYTITLAKGSDVVPNPDLNSLSVATNTFNQLRNLSIKDFEEKISEECDHVSKFAELSLNNWSMVRNGIKSEDEAQKYSEILVKQTLGTQSKMYEYTELDSVIRKVNFSAKMNQTLFIDLVKKYCRNRLAPKKYFEILNDSRSSIESEKNIDLNELEEKKIQRKIKSALINLNQSVPKGSKLTPKGIKKKLDFSEDDLNVSYMLMAEDIKNTMTKLHQPWYVYRYVLNKKYADYEVFLKNGGYNEQFAILALRTKILNQKSNNFKNIFTFSFKAINSLKDIPFTGDRNQLLIWTKLLGYEELDQLN
ncbi:hypothetical protein SASC598O02_007640 [Snodgrassella alvi SCGC AB-598-O02]|nr:hypothetical protein SASC598O02_007640 [Snodgrassella alvi SCGC AB-598-O02]